MKIGMATFAAGALAAGTLLACSTPTQPAASVSKAELAVHQADAKADTQESRANALALQQSIQSLQEETERNVDQGVVR